MKYIDAEKLLSEIERRKKQDTTIRERSILIDIETAINSLQQEQPDNEDIDKVAQELYEHLCELKRHNYVPTNLYDKKEIIDLWKAGIEYGRNHPKQEQPEVDLDSEIIKYKVPFTNESEYLNETTLDAIARHFAEWGAIHLNARKEE